MNAEPALSLVDRLRVVAHCWVTASQSSLSRLGKAVVNDGGFFTRLETQVQGTTTATLERFAAFLGDSANWPEGAVPQEAIDLAHRVGITPVAGALSAGHGEAISRDRSAERVA